jgi:hypothetical protein
MFQLLIRVTAVNRKDLWSLPFPILFGIWCSPDFFSTLILVTAEFGQEMGRCTGNLFEQLSLLLPQLFVLVPYKCFLVVELLAVS